MYKQILPLVVLAFVLVSCSDTPSDPGVPTTTTVPKTGSTFTFETVQTDTSTGAPIESTRRDGTSTITATGLSYMGRSTAVKFTSEDNGTTAEGYINYPSDGDFEMLQAASVPGGLRYAWARVPVKSKGTATTVLYDSTMAISGFVYRNTMSAIYEFVGTESLVTPAGTFEVARLKQITRIYFNFNGSESTQELVGYIYYSYKLGFPIKTDYSLMRISSSGAATTGVLSVLKSYDLK